MCIPFLKMIALFSTFSPVKQFLCCLLCVLKIYFLDFNIYAFPFLPFHAYPPILFPVYGLFFINWFLPLCMCVTKYLITICLDLIILLICTYFSGLTCSFFREWPAPARGRLFLPLSIFCIYLWFLVKSWSRLGFPLSIFVVYWCHPH